MSITERPGLLGGQEFYLRNDEEAPYVRSKVPILPQRTDIEGDSGGVTPDPLLRHWTQEDFSAGAGYPLWATGPDGFSTASGVVWNSFRQALEPSPNFTVDDTFTDGGPFYLHDGYLCTSGNGGTDRLTAVTPTWATDSLSVKAATTPVTVGVISDTATVKSWSTYTNGDLYLGAALWKAFGGATVFATEFQDKCYVTNGATELHVMDNFTTPTTSTLKVTTPYNTLVSAGNPGFLTSSGVGPVWLVKRPTGDYELWEYNVAADTDAVIATLPANVDAGSVLFAYNGYWVPYVEDSHLGFKSLWLWFLVNGVQGRVGPFDGYDNSSVAPPQVIGTTDQNEICILLYDKVYAYDVVDTSFYELIDTTLDTVSGSTGIDYGIATGSGIALAHDNGKVAVYNRQWSRFESGGSSFDLELGAFDGGYPGVRKQLTSVTVSTEPLQAGTEVRLLYRFDQGSGWSFVAGSHDTVGETTHTWYPSVEYPNNSGDLIQLMVRLISTTAANRGPYLRKVSASVMPDEAFLEWDLNIDLGDDRSGRLDSKVTADWLWGLGQETTFVDPWSVREHEAGESHTVRVLERQLGPVGRDGPQYARVKLRKVERV